jgi:hypothetical protein
MDDKGLPDFDGKVVIFYLSHSTRWGDPGVVLEYPKFENIDGRLFVRGRIPEMEGQEWISSTQAAVLWEAVIHWVEYKSIEEYRTRMAQYKPSLLQRLKG